MPVIHQLRREVRGLSVEQLHAMWVMQGRQHLLQNATALKEKRRIIYDEAQYRLGSYILDDRQQSLVGQIVADGDLLDRLGD